MKTKNFILLLCAFSFLLGCTQDNAINDDDDMPKVGDNVNFTPCQQNKLRSSESSDKVDVEFTDRGVQITHYDFGVTCDFTTVDVSHTLVNGVLNITQQGFPNQAKCICYTDVSYTIDGISQNEVNVIFINGVQVYCYNENNESKNANGIIVGYVNCSGPTGLFIVTEENDYLLSFNVPVSSIGIDSNSLIGGAHDITLMHWYINISFSYVMAVGEEIKQDILCPQNMRWPGFSYGPIEKYNQIIITDIKEYSDYEIN